MKIIADLHTHGRYSRGCSTQLTIPKMEKYAIEKGVTLLGTGDFTHPEWIKEIKTYLTENGEGILQTKNGFNFMLTTEISLIYTANGKGRRIHLVVLAPNLDAVSNITKYLLTKGRVDYDGRPIFKIPCPEFVEALRNIDKNIEVIPAHIWTPWFGLFGSKGGFDSVEEAFEDQAKHIHAIETGLSSDPPMNWRVSSLDKFNLVSFSDLHSFWPWRMGREATIIEGEMKYEDILKAIRTGENLSGTIEVDPNYGKYHLDGHRNCNVSMEPEESRKINKKCPKCNRELTIGVLHRIEELADRPEGYKPKNHKPFWSLIPLSEIISKINGCGIATQKVWKQYYEIMKGTHELHILQEMTHEALLKKTSRPIADAILQVRLGSLKFVPGYDGEYGVPLFEENPVFPNNNP